PAVIVTPVGRVRDSSPRPRALAPIVPTVVPLTATVYVVPAVRPRADTLISSRTELNLAVPVTPVALVGEVSDAVNLTWANVPVRSPTVIVSPAARVTPVNFACPLPEASVATVPRVEVAPVASVAVTFRVELMAA